MPATFDLAAKVAPAHLARDAYVYVRQSTLTQVREHTESLERQYELAFRAQALGWSPPQVVVIDEDLGRSGAEASQRAGFKNLVADVGLGKVGIILGIEVSRLARNNADWYQLLDLCAVTDTLIADGDGIYHPADFNDRLVLGLKGTMSEAELHLIRHRLTAGLRHKAAKGELRQGLPVGFVYDDADRVVMDPNEAVVEAIATVFRRFDELGSARQVMLSLRGDGLLIPRRPSGAKRVAWAPATYPAIHDFLTNPTYAGAFVFGRTRTEKRVDASGRLVSRTRYVPRDEWSVLIPDHHPGFVVLGTFRADPGPVAGQLAAAEGPRRRCGAGGDGAAAGPAALRAVRADDADRLLGERRATAPATRAPGPLSSMATSGTARAWAGAGSSSGSSTRCSPCWRRRRWPPPPRPSGRPRPSTVNDWRVFELAVERARFEAERARRQFDAVEPENRLVGRTLERTWEEALVAQRRAEADLTAQRARQPTRLTERGGGVAGPGRSGCAGGVQRTDDDMAGAQAAAAGRHRRDRRDGARRRPPGRRAGDLGGRRHQRVRPRPEQGRWSLPGHRRGHGRPGASPRRAL